MATPDWFEVCTVVAFGDGFGAGAVVAGLDAEGFEQTGQGFGLHGLVFAPGVPGAVVQGVKEFQQVGGGYPFGMVFGGFALKRPFASEVHYPASKGQSNMDIVVDPDLQATLEFMRDKITASKLVAVAKRLPEMATLIWGHFPQEEYVPVSLVLPKPALEEVGGQ